MLPRPSAAPPDRSPRRRLLPADRGSRRIVALPLAVLGAVSIGFPVWLSGWSMEPALANGSLMLVDRLEPELLGVSRGEIVVFIPLPHLGAGYLSLTKRVIGLPGDVVTVGGGQVTVEPPLVGSATAACRKAASRRRVRRAGGRGA